MNLIFGKYQLNVCQFNDSGHITNARKLLYTRLILVFGFGSTKVKWLLAHIGGSRNLRISSFLVKSTLIDRERLVSKAVFKNYFQFVGVDLKRLQSQQKFRTKQFLTAFKNPVSKKLHNKGKNKRKKLI